MVFSTGGDHLAPLVLSCHHRCLELSRRSIFEKMFLHGPPPALVISQRDVGTLCGVLDGMRKDVAGFLANEIGRAERVGGARSMLDHVTLESLVLYRLGSGKLRFHKLTFGSRRTNRHRIDNNARWRGIDRHASGPVNRMANP